MKNLLSFTLLLFSFNAFAQSGITWSASVNVNTSASGNQHPRVTFDAAGNPLILWGQSAANRVRFSKWNGTAFTAPAVLNPITMPVFAASWAGPDIAAYGDTVYVTFKVTPEDTGHMFMIHSFDGGANFSLPVQIDNLLDTVTRFPIVTTDNTGNPIVAFMKFNQSFGDARYVVNRSYDYGNSFTNDVLASQFSGGNVCDCCPASVVAEGNIVATMYRDNLNNLRNMWAGISTDTGSTFNNGMQIDQTNWMIMSCPSSGPDGVIIGDSLYSIFMSSASGMAMVYKSASSISTLTAGPTIPVTGMVAGLQQQNFPRMAKNGGAVAMVFKHVVNGVSYVPLYFTGDINNGFPAMYDTVVTSMSNSIMNADVAISNGTVHVVWEDMSSGTVRYRKGTFTTAGINENTKQSSFEIFPNPAHDILNIRLNNPSVLTITNALGKQVYSKITNKSVSVNAKEMDAGIYFVTVKDDLHSSVQKIIIQH